MPNLKKPNSGRSRQRPSKRPGNSNRAGASHSTRARRGPKIQDIRRGENLQGVTPPPPKPKPIVRIDWDTLEREFILNTDFPSVRTWFREVKKWDLAQVSSGNFFERTMGWGSKRADFQKKITEEALEGLKQLEKERLPQLMTAKLNLVTQIMGEVSQANWQKLTAKDKKLIYEILKNELNEPTSTGAGLRTEEGDRIPILGIIGVVDGKVQANNGPAQNRRLKEAN